MKRPPFRIALRALRFVHCALCFAAVATNAATVVCESSVETNAPPRSELSVANAAGKWPRKARRFGVARAAILEQGEEPPSVDEAPRRHPRDAAEHAVDFAAFKAECANGGFVIGWATSMENVRPRGGFKWRKADKVGVRLARGEYESVQILVAPNGKDLSGVQVAVDGDLKSMQNAECRMQNDGAAARQDAAPPGGPAAVPAVAGKMPASPGTDEPSNRQTVKLSNRQTVRPRLMGATCTQGACGAAGACPLHGGLLHRSHCPLPLARRNGRPD